ncbi:hypothetical protein OAS86_07260, partial [Gammaproteobacteria bacterium]|nr:hypothetical protein [Gammaproteobacteria bacterium]
MSRVTTLQPTTAPAFWRYLNDARYRQLAVLSSLLGYGLMAGILPNPALVALGFLAATLAFETALANIFQRSPSWPSAAISGVSLALLLRTDSFAVVIGAAGIAIGGKYLLRWRGRHPFNPSALALVACVVAS